MGRRLADIEQELKVERRRASAWGRTHAKDLPPAHLPKERIRAADEDTGERSVRRRLVLQAFEGWEDWHPVFDERSKFVPMQGQEGSIDLREADMAARVQHVLDQLPEERRELLLGYYVEGITWKELRRGKETRQSFHERLAWARKAFEEEWLKHAECTVTLTEEDF